MNSMQKKIVLQSCAIVFNETKVKQYSATVPNIKILLHIALH